MSESQSTNKLWCGAIPSAQIIEQARHIKLLLMDVDGVLTDGKIYYMPQAADTTGKAYESKGFDAHDGLGFYFLHDAGIESGFISGRRSEAVVERAANFGVKYVRQGNLQKLLEYEDILKQAGLSSHLEAAAAKSSRDKCVAYIGDDFTDIPLLKRVGLACAVANARAEVKEHAHFITQTSGGQGAVREIIELILKAQNKWQSVIAKYL